MTRAGDVMKIGIFVGEVGDHGFFRGVVAVIAEVNGEQGERVIDFKCTDEGVVHEVDVFIIACDEDRDGGISCEVGVERKASVATKAGSNKLDGNLLEIDAISVCEHPALKGAEGDAKIADDL